MQLDLREIAASIALERDLAAQLPELPHLRQAAQATWRARMVNEYCSARVFEALARQLEAAGLPLELVEECRGFADEERRHGALCAAVLIALGGDAAVIVDELPEVPAHEDAATPLEAAMRNVLSISCLSETVAVALIGAERLEMPEGALRTLLTTIYADEVGHARFGWALLERGLAGLDAPARERLGRYLSVALAHLERHELAHLPNAHGPVGGEALGLCSGIDARALFFDTVQRVIVPGLAARGLHALAA